MLFDGVQDKHIGVQFETALLVDNTSELFRSLEFRRAGGQMQEETFLGGIQPFQDFLNPLAVQTAANDALGEMLLPPV